MLRNSSVFLVIFGFMLVFGGPVISAQNAPISGTIELVKADGTREPVEGAVVEPFRSDIKAGAPSAKTNKRGEFSFAGFPLGSTFILSISAPGISPTYVPGVKAGQERLLVTVSPGDGRKLTEDEVRSLVAQPKDGSQTAQNTEEMKKAQAEYEAKKKEIEERNKKAEDTNKIVGAALKAGNDAFQAKNYDLAIAKYDEGIAADPDYVGSAPIFHNNRSAALVERGVDAYNKGVKATDASEKVANMAKAKQDFAEASTGSVKAWNVLKNASAADIVDKANYEATKTTALVRAMDTFRMAVRTEQVAPETIEAAKLLLPEYLNAETDAAKKAAASLTFADLYRISEDREAAIAAYKKVLETSPDNIDAMAYVGIVLVDLGWIKDNDKALSQEGANYLQKFVAAAPDSHRLKSGAVEYLNILKTQNVVPTKAATPPRRRP